MSHSDTEARPLVSGYLTSPLWTHRILCITNKHAVIRKDRWWVASFYHSRSHITSGCTRTYFHCSHCIIMFPSGGCFGKLAHSLKADDSTVLPSPLQAHKGGNETSNHQFCVCKLWTEVLQAYFEKAVKTVKFMFHCLKYFIYFIKFWGVNLPPDDINCGDKKPDSLSFSHALHASIFISPLNENFVSSLIYCQKGITYQMDHITYYACIIDNRG